MPTQIKKLKGNDMSDQINKVSHYNQGNFEVIDVIEDWKLDFHRGNAIKYIARAPYKGDPVTDIEKAIYYLKRYCLNFYGRNLEDDNQDT